MISYLNGMGLQASSWLQDIQQLTMFAIFEQGNTTVLARTANYSAQIRMDDSFWEWEVEYNVSQLWHLDQNGKNLLGIGMPMFYGITPLASAPGMVTECQEATTITDQTTHEVTGLPLNGPKIAALR
eukprot:Gb_19244 [translate_table: standard]